MFQRCVGRISGILQKLVGLCSFLARSFFVYCRLKLLMSLAAMSVVDSEDFPFNGQFYLAEAFDGPSSMSYSLIQSATLFGNFWDYTGRTKVMPLEKSYCKTLSP